MTSPTAGRSSRFDSLQQEAFLNLWRTYDRLRALEDDLFAKFDLTPQQYNVLRLLKSAWPTTLGASSIAERLVSRAPDVTRMLDKLEQRGLISRDRAVEDRRSVLIGITGPGLELLDQIAAPLQECHNRQIGHLSRKELQTLISLLQDARAPHESEQSPWLS